MKKGLYYEKSNVKGMGCLYYYFGQSANIEKVGERGLSHYAEHLLCKSFDHLLPTIKSYGITYNAATYDDFVIFYWVGLDENLTKLEPELKNLFSFTPTQEQFESERNIILQEYNQVFADQNAVFLNVERKYFNYYDPIGAKDDIENVTYEQMLKFLERFRNPTSIIRISNNRKKNVKQIYSGITFKKESKHSPIKSVEFVQEGSSKFPNAVKINDWVDITGKLAPQEIVILSGILSSGLDTPLYQEIREKRGLCYGLRLSGYQFQGNNVCVFTAMTTNDKVDEIRDVVLDVLSHPETYITKELYEYSIEAMKNDAKKRAILNYGFSNIIDIIYDREFDSVLSSLSYERILQIANILKTELSNLHYASYGEDMLF